MKNAEKVKNVETMKSVTLTDPVQSFKDAFARHAAGVAIITANLPDGTPTGFTATSLASLSAEPARATFNIAQIASSFPALVEGAPVAIHFLGREMSEIAKKFAADNSQRFVGEHWHRGVENLPILEGNSAVLITRVAKVVPMAQNAVVIVDVLDGEFSDDNDPLLYHQRKFHVLKEI